MAHIAIFCDGTWNSPKNGTKTHVLRMAEACDRTPRQKILYFQGVGTGVGMVSALGVYLNKLGGGLFGWGLNRNIKSAYLELCRLYQPGDKIMIFGFSRGAYTARSLTGMIRKCGILADPTPRSLRAAFRLYRSRGPKNAPDSPKMLAARQRLSPNYATSQKDVLQRGDHSYLVRITYLGVWDTVGALGIPKSILGRIATLWNARYEFHDTTLTHLVETARHAVALDEKRVFFEPSLWNNLDAQEGDPGLNHGDESERRHYQQMWFSGSHGIVGGSTAPEGLALASLLWIWEGAAKGGLTLKPGALIPHRSVDPSQSAPDLYAVNAGYRFLPWLLQWRRGPSAPKELHDTARRRASQVLGYRPKSLQQVLPGLFRIDPR